MEGEEMADAISLQDRGGEDSLMFIASRDNELKHCRGEECTLHFQVFVVAGEKVRRCSRDGARIERGEKLHLNGTKINECTFFGTAQCSDPQIKTSKR